MNKFLLIDDDGLPTYILKKNVNRVSVTSQDEDEEPEVQETVIITEVDESGETFEYEVYGPIGYAASIILELNEGI